MRDIEDPIIDRILEISRCFSACEICVSNSYTLLGVVCKYAHVGGSLDGILGGPALEQELLCDGVRVDTVGRLSFLRWTLVNLVAYTTGFPAH